MPVKVKFMDPVWIVAYAELSPTLDYEKKDKISKALKKYEKDSDDAATLLNNTLMDITGIPL
jgi:hypothetical protein